MGRDVIRDGLWTSRRDVQEGTRRARIAIGLCVAGNLVRRADRPGDEGTKDYAVKARRLLGYREGEAVEPQGLIDRCLELGRREGLTAKELDRVEQFLRARDRWNQHQPK
ncbi:MAG: hypothetical protein U0790_09390 [Isosphaeraceae bacterium]